MRITSTLTRKLVLGVGVIALMAPLAACSNDDAADASAKPEPVAQIDQLTGQTTEVILDAGFVDALGSLKVAPGVLGDAKLVDGSLIFPITGGNVTYYEPGSVSPYVQGNIEHDNSGLSLTAGGIEVDLTDFAIDPGTQKVYGDVAVDGKSAATDAYIFHLDGSTLKPLQTGANDTAILEGTKVEISGDAAALLNETFGTDGVTENLLVGTAKITVNTK
jgi:hypothetical protein